MEFPIVNNNLEKLRLVGVRHEGASSVIHFTAIREPKRDGVMDVQILSGKIMSRPPKCRLYFDYRIKEGGIVVRYFGHSGDPAKDLKVPEGVDLPSDADDDE